jgi:hypothetical protein
MGSPRLDFNNGFARHIDGRLPVRGGKPHGIEVPRIRNGRLGMSEGQEPNAEESFFII